ncbi:MAG: hypothetical protein ABMA14_14325 [Hyphomonadaceae bacterium]
MDAFDTPGLFLRRAGFTVFEGEDAARLMTEVLPSLSPKTIYAALFEVAPEGLLSVLKKLDDKALQPETYSILVDWHRDAAQGRRCQMLSRMVTLDEGRIGAIAALDDVLLVPALLPRVNSRPEAERLNRYVDTVRALCTTATEDNLHRSAHRLQGILTIKPWLEEWLRMADKLPPPPFRGDAECSALITAAEVEDAAQRFRNCIAGRYMPSILTGKVCFVEYKPEPALALLARLTKGGWLLMSVHGPKNRLIDADHAERVKAKVLGLGASIFTLEDVDPDMLRVLQDIFGWFDPFEMDFQAIDI